MSTADLAIEAVALTKRFRRVTALDGLDLAVRQGTVLGYLGPNGAGKTTTIKLVAGLWRPTSGSVAVLGRDVNSDRDAVQATVGYLPGDFTGYPGMTGRQLLRLLGSLRGGVDPTRQAKLVDRFHLDLDRRIGELSHGNRQKVGIVQAFMHQPPLLLLDEPTIGLDPLMQREFLELVREERARGTTVLLSSHVLSEVAAVADDVAVIHEGRRVLCQPLATLRATAPRTVDLTFAHEVPTDLLGRVPGVRSVTVRGSSAEVLVTGSPVALVAAAAHHGLVDVVTHEADLSDIFLGLYDGEEVERDDIGLREGAVGAA